MSDCKASVTERPDGFRVEGYERIEYDFAFIDDILGTSHNELADCYKKWGRCLAVMDKNMFGIYGSKLRRYFDHHDIDLDVHQIPVGEKAKSLDTFLSIVDSMTQFGVYRKVSQQDVNELCSAC
jgi:3-dehydroquinate synthase